MDLVRQVARELGADDRTELESVLTEHLAAKVLPRRAEADDWLRFVAAALRNRAKNWLRDRARLRTRTVRLDVSGSSDAGPAADIVGQPGPEPDDRIALDTVHALLNSRERRLLDALVRTEFNQSRAAKLLGMHRNTVRSILHRIRAKLARAGRNAL